MKRALIVCMLVFPLFISAQTTPGGGTDPNVERKKALEIIDLNNAYLEIVISEGTSGAVNMRLDPGRDQIGSIRDKETAAMMAEFRALTISNIPDAMAFLSTKGFNLISNYTVTIRDRHETHLVFEKELIKKGMPSTDRPAAPAKGGTRPGQSSGGK